MIAREAIAGVILAGGLSRRMGGTDKGLVVLDGVALVAHARNRLAPQVARLVVSANGDHSRFEPFCLPVIGDAVPGHAGPLAGIHAAFGWARENLPGATHLLSVAADTPFFPEDLAKRLGEAVEGPQALAVAAAAGRVHPVFGLWPLALERELEEWLAAGNRKVMDFVTRHNGQEVAFPLVQAGADTVDPFFNINTPGDLDRAEMPVSLVE